MKNDFLPMSQSDNRVENLGPKPETLLLLDKLIEENMELQRSLQARTKQLRELQRAVDSFLMNSDTNSNAKDPVNRLKEML